VISTPPPNCVRKDKTSNQTKIFSDFDPLNLPDLLLGDEEIHHSSQEHVIKGVNPHWC
jgi:hypothetical protein